ncbi:hypothetical protein TorRG33x02_002400 [Trema orientale]|uniref:Uncharacterized protein n=1 Tax=Trema orientale TaxID=63057 RepID=A0A2P5G1N2_TREOI|nr:hypothetical protein TorRG33x02_002400 [Trema orientale]
MDSDVSMLVGFTGSLSCKIKSRAVTFPQNISYGLNFEASHEFFFMAMFGMSGGKSERGKENLYYRLRNNIVRGDEENHYFIIAFGNY